MMRAGDIVRVDFGVPQGSEPGFIRPAIVITADNVLRYGPRTVHVIPITSNTTRNLPTELSLSDPSPDRASVAQVHLCAVISTARIIESPRNSGNVGGVQLAQLRALLGDLLDLG